MRETVLSSVTTCYREFRGNFWVQGTFASVVWYSMTAHVRARLP